ncbi:MAG: hypothetical protein ACFFC1_02135, partial [Promethearchaeota archaeon]
LIFLDKLGIEVSKVEISLSQLKDEINVENSKIEAPNIVRYWPKGFLPLNQQSNEIKKQLKLNPNDGLFLSNTIDYSYFLTYCYLPPEPNSFPWYVATDEIGNEPALKQDFLIAIMLKHRQEWKTIGYSRGELIHSLPLAPGEETTIEVLSWDRNIYKREEETINDMEREIEANKTYKDNREVLKEIEKNTKLKKSGDIGLNLKCIPLSLSGGIDSDNEERALNKSSQQIIKDTTNRAVTNIKSHRKTLISSSREFGHEEKVTRKISNTNRCHTVTYHFFEVLRNYELRTQLHSVQPIILVKQKYPIIRDNLFVTSQQAETFLENLRWLHSNMHIFSKGLLDRDLFNAIQVIPELVGYWDTVTNFDEIKEILKPLAENVVSNVRTIYEGSESNNPNIENLNYFIQIASAEWIYEDILFLDSNEEKNPIEGALRYDVGFLESIEQFLIDWDNPITGYEAIFTNVQKEAIGNIVHLPLFLGPILELKYEFEKLVGDEFKEEIRQVSADKNQKIGEVIRLLRHIERHFIYYCQLIWADEDSEERLLNAPSVELPGGYKLSDVIDSTILGFFADYAAYSLNEEFIFEDSTLGRETSKFLNILNDPNADIDSQDVILPSNGITEEPQLGEFYACEPFIQEHRRLDLEQKRYEVDRINIENKRRIKKVVNCQLENPECCPPRKYNFFSRWLCRIFNKDDIKE